MSNAINKRRFLAALQGRFDRHAIDQLRDEVAKLAEKVEALNGEVDSLKSQLAYAHQDADMWRDHANDIRCHLDDSVSVGITKEGELLVIDSRH